MNGNGFLTVGLAVAGRSRAQLAPLIDGLQGRLFDLYQGRTGNLYVATYEATAMRGTTPTATIHALTRVIESLDAPGQRAWRAARRRDFDMGVEVAGPEWTRAWTIEPEAVERVAALGGRIVFGAHQRRPDGTTWDDGKGRPENSAGFLNVDLEVAARSRAKIAPLLEAFDREMVGLYQGRERSLYLATYEVISVRAKTPSATIHALASVVDSLDAAGRRAWRAARKRNFDVGVEIAPRQWTSVWTIEPDAVKRVAALGGRIVFTAYLLAAMKRPAGSRAR